MADRKITDLTALAAGSQATGDLLTIVDVSESAAADKNKKITVESLFQGIPSNVGIGTASPAHLVHIAGTTTPELIVEDTTNNVKAVVGADNSVGRIGTDTDHALTLRVNDSEKIRIDSDGRLKIGTSSTTGNQNDADLLVVGSTQGELYLSRGSTPGASGSGLGFIKFTGNNGQDAAEITCFSDGGTWTNGSSHPTSLRFTTTADGASSPTERLRIDSSGRVGINETALGSFNSIADDLVISQSSGSAGITVRSSTTGSGTLAFTDGANTSFQGDIRYVHNGDYMRFTTDGDERMRLTSDGKLGIGTTSPSVLLHVNESTGAHANLILQNSEGSAKLGTNSNIFYVESSQHIFYNSGGSTEYARIDSSGRLLLGASSGSYDLEVKKSGRVEVLIGSTDADGATLLLDGDSNGDGAGSDYASVGHASSGHLEYKNRKSSGAHTFHTGSSDTERMRIDSSGRLLINHTADAAPDGFASKLQLVDTSYQGSSITIRRDVNNDGSPVFIFAKSRSGSKGGHTSVNNGDNVGIILFYAADGTDTNSRCAEIRAQIDNTPGSNDVPGRLTFHTTADGASTPTERVRISENGRFSAYSDSDTVFAVRNAGTAAGSAAFAVYNNSTSTTTGTVKCVIRQDGDLENTNNNYGALSDVKLKENIVDAASQWDDLKGIQVRKYNFKEETGHETHTQIGVIAQEIETVSPGLVSESPDLDDEGNDLGTVTKSVNYSVLYMKAVKALQEAMDRIETLEAKVAALEAQ